MPTSSFSHLPHPPLLLITDRAQCRRPLRTVVAEALVAGCRWVSVREKDLPEAELARLVWELLPLAERAGARLTVHGDPAAARLCHGVHLPAGGDVARARSVLGAGALIGLSCHSGAEVAVAVAAGADYATLSPIFPSPSKPGHGPALGTGALTGAGAAGLPVLALGGVEAGNAAACLHAGAAGVAVMGSVMRAEAPGAVVAGLLAAMSATPPASPADATP